MVGQFFSVTPLLYLDIGSFTRFSSQMSLSLDEHLLVAGLDVMVRISLNTCMLMIRDADVLLLFPLPPFSVTVMPKGPGCSEVNATV